MFSKINVSSIIRDHITTLRDQATDRVLLTDIFLFFVIPMIISMVILFFLGYRINETFANVLITSLSVFSALLFNLLLLIYDIVRREQASKRAESLKVRKYLAEIFANISFSILVCVICIVILLLSYIEIESSLYYLILSALIYYLVAVFILTIFMVLKRVHVLLSKEVRP